MKFQFNDGGRQAAGFKHKKHCGDCVCRAIAIATERPYSEIYALILHFAKQERTSKRKQDRSDPERGVYRTTVRKVMSALGWEWVPTMGIGTGCKVHLCADELPAGRIVVNVSHHFTAVVDGVINDIYDPSRGESRCVYGYYRPTASALKPSDTLPIAVDAPRKPQERSATKSKATTPPDAETLQRARRAQNRATPRYTPDGWRIFTTAEMRRVAESFIPAELRPYYTGCEIDTEYGGKLTADNSEIYLYFKKPVVGPIGDTRYVHSSLYYLTQELDACFVGDGLTDDDDYYADYDDYYGHRPVVPIKGDPVTLQRDRDALRSTWRRHAQTRAA